MAGDYQRSQSRNGERGGQEEKEIDHQMHSATGKAVIGRVEYYHCGSDYDRAAFLGNNLVDETRKELQNVSKKRSEIFSRCGNFDYLQPLFCHRCNSPR
jgi:hypothetical protein